MRKILSTIAIVAATAAYAQVGISGVATDTPEATLDVKAIIDGTNPDGLLIPRVNEAYAQSMPTPVTSTLVYVTDGTDADDTRTGQVDAPGFYYFDSIEWVKLGGAGTLYAADVNYRINSVTELTPQSFIGYDAVVFTAQVGNIIPNPADYTGKSISIINNSTVNVTLGVDGAGSIVPTEALRRNTSFTLVSDGTNWYRISS